MHAGLHHENFPTASNKIERTTPGLNKIAVYARKSLEKIKTAKKTLCYLSSSFGDATGLVDSCCNFQTLPLNAQVTKYFLLLVNDKLSITCLDFSNKCNQLGIYNSAHIVYEVRVTGIQENFQKLKKFLTPSVEVPSNSMHDHLN